ncbi:MAG: 4Fe-4S binding protein [Phascolarctobacterium faecium]
MTSCITMAPDEEGFNYPLVDTDKCIHCGLCERVCPLLHKPQPHEILAVIGCKNKKSRSLCQLQRRFSPRCRKILGRQGTVFGAAFDDNWHVRHIAVTSVNAMNKLRGSKYVQSDISTTYQDAENCFRQAILFIQRYAVPDRRLERISA